MGEFSPYEKVEQIDLAGFVWTARKEGDSAVKYVLKFCAPPGEALRSAAELQKKLADGKGVHWAPVHHVGTHAGGGAFYVTDQFKWSAQLVFDQKDRFTSAGLFRLMRGASAALDQIATAYGRVHGNLKRSNLLLTDRNLDKADVVLGDPAAPNSPELRDPTADRRSLGRIMYELVAGQDFRDYLWPVRGQKKWETLGPDGAKWLDWCNRLLAPPGDATAMEIGQFAKELAGFGPAGAGGAKKPVMLIAAAAAVVLVAGGVGFLVMHKSPGVATNAPTAPLKNPALQPTPVAPSPAPTPTAEPDPRLKWDFASLASAIQQRDDMARQVSQIKNDLAGIPGVADAVKDVPVVDDPTADIKKLNWPTDKSTLESRKADLDRATQQARQIVQSDPVAAAWQQALGGLSTVTFHTQPVQNRWNAVLAQAKTKSAADALPVHLPDLYARLSALDGKADSTDPQVTKALSDELDHAANDTGVTPQLLVTDLDSRVADIAKNLSTAQMVTTLNADVKTAQALTFPSESVTQRYQKLVGAVAQSASDQIKSDPAHVSLTDIEARLTALKGQAADAAKADTAIAAAQAELKKPDSLDSTRWKAIANSLDAAARLPADWRPAGVEALRDQTRAVASALGSSNPFELLDLAKQGKSPAVFLAVCDRWMSMIHGDADLDYQTFQAVKAGLNPLPKPVIDSLSQRWLARIREPKANVDHLWDLYGKMGLDPDLPAATFNSMLEDLQAKAKTGGLSQDALDAFEAGTERFANPHAPGAVRIAQIRESLSKITFRPKVDLSRDFKQDGNDLILVSAFAPNYPLRFIRIPAAGAVHSYFLCTTDIPVGWFAAAAAQHQALMAGLMDYNIPNTRCGPAAWKSDGAGGITAKGGNDGWLGADVAWQNSLQSLLQPPSDAMPMQYVSPLAAMYAASLESCRLPTGEEWIAAYRSGLLAGEDNSSGANFAQLANQVKQLTPPQPGEQKTLAKFRKEVGIDQPFAGPVRPQGTGELWFRKTAPAPARLTDMAGNISDWVLDAPYVVAPSSDGVVISVLGGSVVAQGAKQDDAPLTGFEKSHCLKIGLSSTSDNATTPDRPVAPPARLRAIQYYDVGFRLALDDPFTGGGSDQAEQTVLDIKPVAP